MGYRTIVIFNNDLLDNLKTNPHIGEQLHSAILSQSLPEDYRKTYQGFNVVEQTHADHVQLLVVDGFSTKCVASAMWNDPNLQQTLLYQMADRLGYNLSKKRTK